MPASDDPSHLSGVILAAGTSRRFGGADKLLARLSGRLVIDHVFHHSRQSLLDEILVVVRPGSLLEGYVQARHARVHDRIRVVTNDDADRGLVTSIRAGLDAVSDHADGAMILLGDMPGVTTPVIDRVGDVFAATNGIVLPHANGRYGHPRAFPRRRFSAFRELDDARSAREVVRRYEEDCVPIDLPVPGAYRDIDTAADLREFARSGFPHGLAVT